MTRKPLNIDEDPINRDWLHSKWTLPTYKSDAFNEELERVEMQLAEFKLTVRYQRGVLEGKIVNDEWVGEK